MSSVIEAGPTPQANPGFIARWLRNVEESGRSPTKALIGFCLAWAAFFLILYVMPVSYTHLTLPTIYSV